MSPTPIGSSLETLLQGVRTEPVNAAAFEAVADHLMGLGYAGLAARWRSWALLPPEASQREAAVVDLAWRLSTDPKETASLSPLPPGSETDPQLLLQRAQELLARGDAAEARRVVTRLAMLTGLRPELCHQAGQLAREAGEPAEAERWFRTGLRQDPANVIAWFALARVLADLEAWDEALAAAEQGLQRAPGHPWGRKLRWLALERSGADHTLTRLAELDGWPDLPQIPAKLENLKRRRQRLERRRWPAPAPLPLAQRVALHRLLAKRPPLWVVLHGRGAGPVALAHNADLLPAGLRLQPLASRDPFRLREALAAFPLEVMAERPAANLAQLAQPGLVVLHRGPGGALPLVLRAVLEQSVPLLAPIGLLTAEVQRLGPGRQTVLRRAGWELLWPNEGAGAA